MGGFSLRRDVGGGEAQEPPMGSHCSTDGGVGHIRCNAKLKILKLLKHKTSRFEDNCKDVCGGSAAEIPLRPGLPPSFIFVWKINLI